MGRSKASVELFEEIRREYEFGVGTIAGVARKLKVHRRLVREALASAVPRERKRPEREKPRLGPLAGFIIDWCLTDVGRGCLLAQADADPSVGWGRRNRTCGGERSAHGDREDGEQFDESLWCH